MKNLPYILILLTAFACDEKSSSSKAIAENSAIEPITVVDTLKLIDYREITFFNDFKSKIYLKRYLFLTTDTTYYDEIYAEETGENFLVREYLKPYKVDIVLKLTEENELHTTIHNLQTVVYSNSGDSEAYEDQVYLHHFERENLLKTLYSYDAKDSLLLDAIFTYGNKYCTIKYNENLVVVFFPDRGGWADFDPPRNEDGSYEYTPIVFYIDINGMKINTLTYNPTLKKNKSNYNYKSDATFKYGQYLMRSIILDIEKLEFSTLNKSLIDLIELNNRN
jgi:hypothetical protein